MKACFNLTLGSYPKTFTGPLWSCTTRQWSLTTHVSACELNSILVLSTARIFWVHYWTIYMLVQITVLLSTQLMMSPLFDKSMSQLGSLHLLPNALFLPHAGSLEVCPSSLISPTTHSSFWELILSWVSRASILAFALVFFEAGLMPRCLLLFPTCIFFSLVVEFQTVLWYLLHSTFPTMVTSLGFIGWLLILALQTDCILELFFLTIWSR